MSVCGTACVERLNSHWADFSRTLNLGSSLKSVDKINISLNWGKTADTLHEDVRTYIYIDISQFTRSLHEIQLTVQV